MLAPLRSGIGLFVLAAVFLPPVILVAVLFPGTILILVISHACSLSREARTKKFRHAVLTNPDHNLTQLDLYASFIGGKEH